MEINIDKVIIMSFNCWIPFLVVKSSSWLPQPSLVNVSFYIAPHMGGYIEGLKCRRCPLSTMQIYDYFFSNTLIISHGDFDKVFKQLWYFQFPHWCCMYDFLIHHDFVGVFLRSECSNPPIPWESHPRERYLPVSSFWLVRLGNMYMT